MDILTKGVNSIFILAVIGFIIFLILLYVHYNVKSIFPFIKGFEPDTIPQINTVNAQTRQTNSENKAKAEKSDTKLEFDKIRNFKYEDISLSFDVFLNGQYISTDVPRVLMYFDTAPVLITSHINENDLPTVFGNSNFIVYCDPVKNDLIVGVITSADGTRRALEKAAVIENIPINKPFQISIILTNKFVEVYKDKSLVKTYKIKNSLTTSRPASINAFLFSQISYIQDTIKIGNVQYFDAPIRSDQLRYATNQVKDKTFFT